MEFLNKIQLTFLPASPLLQFCPCILAAFPWWSFQQSPFVHLYDNIFHFCIGFLDHFLVYHKKYYSFEFCHVFTKSNSTVSKADEIIFLPVKSCWIHSVKQDCQKFLVTYNCRIEQHLNSLSVTWLIITHPVKVSLHQHVLLLSPSNLDETRFQRIVFKLA